MSYQVRVRCAHFDASKAILIWYNLPVDVFEEVWWRLNDTTQG